MSSESIQSNDLSRAIPPLDSFPPPPREIRRRRRRAMMVLSRSLSLLLVILLVGFAGVFCGDVLTRFAGTPINATVTRKRESRGKRTSYYISFRYTIDAKQLDDDESVSRAQYDQLLVGGPVPARTIEVLGYRISSLTLGNSSYWITHWFWVLGLAFGSFMVPRFYRDSWIIPAREKVALRDGEATVGQVMSKRTSQQKNRTDYFLTFQYEARLPNSPPTPYTREMGIVAADFERMQIGETVTVFYDLLRPKFGVAYEVCDFEITNG